MTQHNFLTPHTLTHTHVRANTSWSSTAENATLFSSSLSLSPPTASHLHSAYPLLRSWITKPLSQPRQAKQGVGEQCSRREDYQSWPVTLLTWGRWVIETQQTVSYRKHKNLPKGETKHSVFSLVSWVSRGRFACRWIGLRPAAAPITASTRST